MATAKLWWNGSSWKTSSVYWIDESKEGNMQLAVRHKIMIAAYSDMTLKLSQSFTPYQTASIYFSVSMNSTAVSVKSGSTTIGTGEFSNANVTSYSSFSYSGSASVTGVTNYTSYNSGNISLTGSTTISSPFRTVTYNANGGSGAPSATTLLTGISGTISSTKPTRTGYSFQGWGTSSSTTTVSYAPGSTVKITSNLALYAVWKAELTTINASNGTIGTALTITLTQQGSSNYSYKHTIKWTINGTTGTIASNLVSSSQTITQSWTPAIATIVPLYTDRSSYSCVLTCETYSGSTLLGSKTKTISLAVPSSCAPSLSGSVSPTNKPSSVSGYVKGKSKAQFAYTATPQYSATIVSWVYTINSSTTTVTDSSTSKTYTPSTAVSSSPVKVKVVDSRGLSSEASTAVTVVAYSAPSVTNVVMTRALQDGTADEQGEYLLVEANIAITALSDYNTKNYAIQYRQKGSSTWLDAQATTALSGYTVSLSWVSSTDILSQTESYEVRLSATDYYSTTTVQQTVSTSASIIDILADGTGVAFGTIASQSNAVQVASGWDLLHGTTSIPTEVAKISGKVDKSGDTMTGRLDIQTSGSGGLRLKNTAMEIGVTPSSAQYKYINFIDKNDDDVAVVYSRINTSGNIALVVGAHVNSTYNVVTFTINPSTNARSIGFTDVAPWLSALGLGTSGELPITIAQGGTGQTAVSSVTTISSIITAASGFSISSATYKQWGKLAMVNIKFKKNSTAISSNTDMTLGTLVSGKRPSLYCQASQYPNGSVSHAWITSGGVVHGYGTWAANGEKDICATFLLP